MGSLYYCMSFVHREGWETCWPWCHSSFFFSISGFCPLRTIKNIASINLAYVCVHVERSQFSPSMMWVLRPELRSSGLVVSTFTGWPSLLPLFLNKIQGLERQRWGKAGCENSASWILHPPMENAEKHGWQQWDLVWRQDQPASPGTVPQRA